MRSDEVTQSSGEHWSGVSEVANAENSTRIENWCRGGPGSARPVSECPSSFEFVCPCWRSSRLCPPACFCQRCLSWPVICTRCSATDRSFASLSPVHNVWPVRTQCWQEWGQCWALNVFPPSEPSVSRRSKKVSAVSEEVIRCSAALEL